MSPFRAKPPPFRAKPPEQLENFEKWSAHVAADEFYKLNGIVRDFSLKSPYWSFANNFFGFANSALVVGHAFDEYGLEVGLIQLSVEIARTLTKPPVMFKSSILLGKWAGLAGAFISFGNPVIPVLFEVGGAVVGGIAGAWLVDIVFDELILPEEHKRIIQEEALAFREVLKDFVLEHYDLLKEGLVTLAESVEDYIEEPEEALREALGEKIKAVLEMIDD